MKAWLFFMNTVYFAVFAPSALFLHLVWHPVLSIFYRGHELQLKFRRSICLSFKFFWYMAAKCRFMKAEFYGLEKLASAPACIIVSNHPTYIDYVLLTSVMPEINCLVKAGIRHKPALRGMVVNAGYLVNQDGPELLEESRQCLERGESILIFPEGTRTPHDGTITLKKGFASLASRLDCPVLVISIDCSEHFLDKQMKWYQVPARMPVFKVTVHELIAPNAGIFGDEENSFRRASRLKDTVEGILRGAVTPKN